jgi:uncharacterized protein
MTMTTNDTVDPIEWLMRLAPLAEYLESDEEREAFYSLAELDGFLTCLAVGPEPISEIEWLPQVFPKDAPAPEGEQNLQKLKEIARGHYADIVHRLDQGEVNPITWSLRDLSIDASDRAGGFAVAMTFREEPWKRMTSCGSGALLAPILLLCSQELGLDEEEEFELEEFYDEDWSTLMKDSADAIPASVLAIAAYWRMTPAEQRAFSRPINSDTKIGRNDPCPCGSGRKFKKCCGV